MATEYIYEIHSPRELSEEEREVIMLNSYDLQELKRDNFNKLCRAVKEKVVSRVREQKLKFVEENVDYLMGLFNPILLKNVGDYNRRIKELQKELKELEHCRDEQYQKLGTEYRESLESVGLSSLARSIMFPWYAKDFCEKHARFKALEFYTNTSGLNWIESELICSKDAWDNLKAETDRFVEEYTTKALERECLEDNLYSLRRKIIKNNQDDGINL